MVEDYFAAVIRLLNTRLEVRFPLAKTRRVRFAVGEEVDDKLCLRKAPERPFNTLVRMAGVVGLEKDAGRDRIILQIVRAGIGIKRHGLVKESETEFSQLLIQHLQLQRVIQRERVVAILVDQINATAGV